MMFIGYTLRLLFSVFCVVCAVVILICGLLLFSLEISVFIYCCCLRIVLLRFPWMLEYGVCLTAGVVLIEPFAFGMFCDGCVLRLC